MNYKHIRIIARSQVNIIAQPLNAEAAEYPVAIAKECQSLANEARLPVVFKDAHENRSTFTPATKPGRKAYRRKDPDIVQEVEVTIKVTMGMSSQRFPGKKDIAKKALQLARKGFGYRSGEFSRIIKVTKVREEREIYGNR